MQGISPAIGVLVAFYIFKIKPTLTLKGNYSIWHLNFDFTSSNLSFYVILILGSWGIGKVADSTHSLLAVSAFHSLNNLFPVLNGVKTILLLSLLALWIIALIIRKKRLTQSLTNQ